MDHFCGSIPGFFSFEQVYRFMVERCPNNSHFVEIGAFLGKSASFMAVEIINSGKNIRFDVVDHWKGSPELQDMQVVKDGTMYEQFIKNIEPVKDFINVISMDSAEASKLYRDNSLDLAYIDGGHEFEVVYPDVVSWYPKVKLFGYIGGHDAHSSGVLEAVKKYFGDFRCSPMVAQDTSWLFLKLFDR